MKKLKVFVDTTVSSPNELREIYARLLPLCPDRTLLLMVGSVGAGKTTSVQMIADLLGMKDVASPSFAIHHRYENKEGDCIDHLDLYRLEDDDDLESTGFWDLFAQKKSLVIVEWADRLESDHLPLNWWQVRVHLETVEGAPLERKVLIEIQSE